ncbi:glycosyltransferase family 1 protein [filamentous cyanobacterium CCT1]|nr:glycosyltransferase family 1 protein [filamentous cyanobacterium CCT1]PSN79756.1 glycosyltransferase family 1 protein [filamentous cyanobacterium CCP4]
MKRHEEKLGDSQVIRVVFFTHYTLLYGANRSLLNLIDGLKDYPVIPYVIAPKEGDITRALQERNISYAIFPMVRWIEKPDSSSNFLTQVKNQLDHQIGSLKRIKQNLKILEPIVEKIRGWKADILYTNSSVLPIGALAAYKAKLPHIWHLREFVDLDYGLKFDWGNALAKKIINRSNAKIAISKAIYSHFSQPKSRDYHIIYNGIARQSEFDYLRQQFENQTTPQKPKPFTFCLIGKINRSKGHETAVRAISLLQKKFKHSKLLIVGDGEDQPIKQLVNQLCLNHCVEFWGRIEDPFKAYLASDAVLMCSKNEGMGRVTVEAMAACKPVIGYDNAGTSEIITHGKTGLLYYGDAIELSAAMEQLIEQPQWGRELALAGWKLAREQFCIEVYAEKVYEVLISTLALKGSTHQSTQFDLSKAFIS